MEQWQDTALSTQCQILVTHAFWCRYLQKEKQGGIEIFKRTIKEMEEYSCKQIKASESTRSKANREVAKLFLLQYYQDLIREKTSDGEVDDTMRKLHDRMIIRYHWLKEQKIFCCTSKMQQGMPFYQSRFCILVYIYIFSHRFGRKPLHNVSSISFL